MQTVDNVDGEVRLTTEWGGVKRYIFVPLDYIADDAGKTVSRNDAVAFVREHLQRYIDEARRQHGDSAVQMIELNRTA